MPGNSDSKQGGVTSAVYLEVLKDMLPTLQEPGLEFMQDNAKIHTAKIIKAWFVEQGSRDAIQLVGSADQDCKTRMKSVG